MCKDFTKENPIENPVCVDCAAGKFQSLESAAPCSDCLAGTHASN